MLLLLALLAPVHACDEAEPSRPSEGEAEASRRSEETRAPSVGREQAEQLVALGYLGYGEASAPGEIGVTRKPGADLQSGLNLITSGHAHVAVLADMEGRVLHRWERGAAEIWSGREAEVGRRAAHFRKVHLLPDGSLLVLVAGLGLARLDPDSEVAWTYDGPVHHDLAVAADGSILTLIQVRRSIPGLREGAEVLDDFVVGLDTAGRELWRLSIHDALVDSPWSHWLAELSAAEAPEAGGVTEDRGNKSWLRTLRRAGWRKGELFHTNAVRILDDRLAGRAPELRAGRILLSIPTLHALATIDPEQGRVVWALRGDWRFQHDPVPVDPERILLFDNLGPEEGSRVVEIDPLDGSIHWSYPQEPGPSFFSRCCGTNQRLANGNTLLTETDQGRAIEIDRTGEALWTYVSPERMTTPRDEDRVARLFEVERIPRSYVGDWLR